MAFEVHHFSSSTTPKFITFASSLLIPNFQNVVCALKLKNGGITSVRISSSRIRKRRTIFLSTISASISPLDLTEENIIQVLQDAKAELAQLFDTSVGITGKAELAELDGPYVKLRLSGKFWHKRSTVVARLGNYLKQRIPVSVVIYCIVIVRHLFCYFCCLYIFLFVIHSSRFIFSIFCFWRCFFLYEGLSDTISPSL